MFLFILVVSTVYGAVILNGFCVSGNSIATANNILNNELPFRIGIICELSMCTGGIVLALALFMMLESVNKHLAMLALLLKMTESVSAAVIALISFTALQTVNGTVAMTEQTKEVFGSLVNANVTLTAVPMLFLGMNFMLFFYLLSRTKYVPGLLSIFGIISYMLIFMFALFTIISPRHVTIVLQSIFWGPSIIFELTIGILLLVKKIDFQG